VAAPEAEATEQAGAAPEDVRLSIVVATAGRPTLDRALASATRQMVPGDELVVVFDDSGDAGDTPRNRVLGSLRGTHVTFLDDDDVYRPGALEAIRRFARANPGRVGIFRINRGEYGTVWQEDARELAHTATAMYVVPNVPGRVGRFGRAPGLPPGRVGDLRFIVETVALQGDPVWCEDVTQEINPERSRLKRLRYRLMLRTRLRRALRRPAPPPPARRSYPEAEAWAERRIAELRRAGRLTDP